MAGKYGSKDEGAEFILAVSDTWLDLENTFGCDIECRILRNDRRRVLTLQLRSVKVLEGGLPVTIAAYTGQWPNASPQSFSGFLFASFNKLYRITEDWWTDYTPEVAPQ